MREEGQREREREREREGASEGDRKRDTQRKMTASPLREYLFVLQCVRHCNKCTTLRNTAGERESVCVCVRERDDSIAAALMCVCMLQCVQHCNTPQHTPLYCRRGSER